MGGDHGPSVTLPACRAFLDAHPDAHVRLVGLPDALRGFSHERATLVEASEVVDMDDPVEVALRKKKDSSMRVAIDLDGTWWEGSEPAAEYDETAAKFGAMFTALGVGAS